ncbi:hypothetical protein [Nocardiopsis listeri]|uniref:hypothetical protein n=1 Tax=Nocardiopsis listeri TaxID=53440 RepID=UPI00082CDE85|nr:hypothetical protein [Nocardiopsis listeri]
MVELEPLTDEVLREAESKGSSGGDIGIDEGSFSQNVAGGVSAAGGPVLRALSLGTGEAL